jgi:AAA domain
MTGRIRLADVQPEQVTWLWPNHIPAGKLVTFDGDPGVGKSVLALTIGAIVTRAGRWPDGTQCDQPGDVLIMSAEDGVADTIRPRLDAADADPYRVHVIEHGLDQSGESIPMTLAATDEIERHITQTGARLLIVDVLMAYIPGDAYRDQDVRKVLTPLAKVAERTGCTVLLVRHLKKSKGGEPVYRGAGSIGIAGAARAGYLVTRDPQRPDSVRILASVKNNLADAPKSLAYTLVGAGNGVVAVEWLGEDDRSAVELLDEPDYSLGKMSCSVKDFVNSRSDTSSDDVAEEFGINRKLANQYLKRLVAHGDICQLARGSYGPRSTSPAEPEESEDIEDHAGRCAFANPHSPTSEDSEKAADLANPQNLHDPQRSAVSQADSGTLTSVCQECDSPLGSTGKCVSCIVKRASAGSRILG